MSMATATTKPKNADTKPKKRSFKRRGFSVRSLRREVDKRCHDHGFLRVTKTSINGGVSAEVVPSAKHRAVLPVVNGRRVPRPARNHADEASALRVLLTNFDEWEDALAEFHRAAAQ